MSCLQLFRANKLSASREAASSHAAQSIMLLPAFPLRAYCLALSFKVPSLLCTYVRSLFWQSHKLYRVICTCTQALPAVHPAGSLTKSSCQRYVDGMHTTMRWTLTSSHTQDRQAQPMAPLPWSRSSQATGSTPPTQVRKRVWQFQLPMHAD